MVRAVCLLLLSFPLLLQAAETLRVVSAGPAGEVATLAEANEIRVVFSEPMVVLGRVPQPVAAPFFRISPAVPGSFRWSGTTTLIFTPKPALPLATRYEVTIDRSARSAAGNTLDREYSFTFTTPTIRLVNTQWYRKGERFDAPLVIGLRFNQAVDPAVVARFLRLQTVAHDIQIPEIKEPALSRLRAKEPQALAAFEAKRAAAQAAASSNGAPVLASLASEWDHSRITPGRELVVLETKPGLPPDTWLQVIVGENIASAEGRQRPGRAQEFTIQTEPTLFVNEMGCRYECDPESGNPIDFRSQSGLRLEDVRKAVTVTDITDPAREVVLTPDPARAQEDYPSTAYTLEDLGYRAQPAHRYAIRVDPSLQSLDGQRLGYTWMGVVEYWHRSAFISFGDGQGVWESSGGTILPFHARNVRSVRQWLAPLSIEQAMPTLLRLQNSGFSTPPPGVTPRQRAIQVVPDTIQSLGLDIAAALGGDDKGLVWAAVDPQQPIPQSRLYDDRTRATVVQVTNLGITVKDSPINTVIMVTTLSDATPVAGAQVSIRTRDNRVFWSGVTDANGMAVAPRTNLRLKRRDPASGDQPPRDPSALPAEEEEYEEWRALGELHFIVVAEKDGDVAYVGSDWNEGISPWDFDAMYNVEESLPQLRGTIFTDRGVYKLGEEVHAKLVLRSDTPEGMRLLPGGTKVTVLLRDSQSKQVQRQELTLNAWSSAEWVFRLPADAPLGTWMMEARVEGQLRGIFGDFLVAAYRRPDFRVDVTTTAPTALAGVEVQGTVSGRYLYGGAMSGRDVRWSWSKRPAFDVPQAVRDRFPPERFAFLGFEDDQLLEPQTIRSEEGKLGANGELRLQLPTDKLDGYPYDYRLEAEVADVTRQRIAGRSSFRTHPAPWYIGVRRPPYFAEAKDGIDTEIVAAGIDGLPAPGVPVEVTLQRIQYNSVRRAVGNGFYEWDSERKEIPAGQFQVTTQSQPVPLHIPLPEGGEYRLVARATDAEGRTTRTVVWFYALGAGYSAWERHDHNRIELIPEKKSYRPGEIARIMIKSPWEKATALLTTEREGVRTHQQFELTSTQQTITVPITEKEIPNFWVSVALVKGRTEEPSAGDTSDPGKPAFRLGYVELLVEDASKRLDVDVQASRDEFRPGSKADIAVEVKDAAGKPSQSEVTLWAVDYGVLSLTAYKTPDILNSIYLRKALQVANEDSRLRIVSRRVLTPKGASEGGGGGRDAGPGTLRKDFRVLAFWVGSLVTDARGRARTQITLPESLTTYRIMAVAGDRASRFGWAEDEIRINKPLMLTPAYPRFLSVGDTATFGGVVHSQLRRPGKATVSIRSLDPAVISIEGSGEAAVDIRPGASSEVRFAAKAHSIGTARIQMRVQSGRESDAFEEVVPVLVRLSPETVAAYGQAAPEARETLQVPANVIPGYGGLRIELSSTAMVGLSEGARYLVEYPYGCAEQQASAALALMLAGDLGEAFRIPGIDPAEAKRRTQIALNTLSKFQCGNGGFAFWPGDCTTVSPYLTAWIVHVFQRGLKLGYTAHGEMLSRANEYLLRSLSEPRPANEGWMPAYTAWQAFVIKTVVEGGKNADSHITRLYGYLDRMPVFGISHLADALMAKGEKGERFDSVMRRLRNSILPEGGFAFVNELNDPILLWLWSSHERSTAIVLGTLVRAGEDAELVTRLVRWLMRVRKDGRWGNTQENAWAMESLVDYYRKYESQVPDFAATVRAGNESLAREDFRGRSSEARSAEIPLARLPQGSSLPLIFLREGTGTLFYMARLRYASAERDLAALDQGFTVERTYTSSTSEESITSFGPGELIRVTLRIRNTKERRFVAVTDPIPAGTEPVETLFATTATDVREQDRRRSMEGDWTNWFRRGGWDHEERHDDRVNAFATRLSEGTHTYSYLLRATTAGTFLAPPTHVEEMYEPEVFGRSASSIVEVRR